MPHKLSLMVPGLCGPLTGLEDIEAAATPLVELLSQGDQRRTPCRGYHHQLATCFGLPVEHGFPAAALSLLGHGIDPGEYCWLHADPVNLLADMDRALLTDSQALDISQDQAARLVKELNAHFAADGMSLLMADRNNWFIRLDACDLKTTPLRQVVGRNINHQLPGGDGASGWRRLLNEVQMLLHISDVNELREQRGQLPVNSLWLWGEGTLPSPGETGITQVYADDHVVAGLARLNQIPFSRFTDPIMLAQAMKRDGHSLVLLGQLDGPCNYGDTAAWLDAMLETIGDWLEPLRQVAVSLDTDVNIYPCNGVRYHFSNNYKNIFNRLMFWKKNHLRDYVETQENT